jgi:hypothetical protein
VSFICACQLKAIPARSLVPKANELQEEIEASNREKVKKAKHAQDVQGKKKEGRAPARAFGTNASRCRRKQRRWRNYLDGIDDFTLDKGNQGQSRSEEGSKESLRKTTTGLEQNHRRRLIEAPRRSKTMKKGLTRSDSLFRGSAGRWKDIVGVKVDPPELFNRKFVRMEFGRCFMNEAEDPGQFAARYLGAIARCE